MSNFMIDRATLADLHGLIPLMDGYRVFYRQPSDPEASRAFLRERFERGESVIFVARGADPSLPLEARQGLAGFAQLYPTFSSVSLGARWILNDLFVDPSHRGTGVGRALTLRCMEHARETGSHGLMLLTEVTNTTAQRLYESLGWKRDETYWRYTWRPA